MSELLTRPHLRCVAGQASEQHTHGSQVVVQTITARANSTARHQLPHSNKVVLFTSPLFLDIFEHLKIALSSNLPALATMLKSPSKSADGSRKCTSNSGAHFLSILII
uniref:Uncharacterized protein n=1 Tax=Erythrolobus australicus TaxID=1077150 RepID=A0A7S1XJ13_9RHOD|mmetsp:Transcript_4270/g.11700  ORF Transcript_4270/g.11700 Transcript_4270/m.11700 type:complete len:108 (+) Transcript_4270:172-495(+)